MTVEEKALNFAIEAHRGQKRKAEPDMPMIFHSLDVGQILKEYGFDENVVAAGFLHDVVEDTKYTFEDIKKEFGEDIESLVKGASEPDKNLDWIIRKQHTIETVKDLDVRHKAVVCADKICNIEDLLFLFSSKGKYDFSAFTGDFKDQQWYYTSALESIKDKGIDKQLKPMIDRCDDLLQKVFYNGDIDIELRNIYFNSDEERYKQIKRLHHQKEGLLKLKRLIHEPDSYLVSVDGISSNDIKKVLIDLNQFPNPDQFKISLIDESNIKELDTNKKDLMIIDENLYRKTDSNILIPVVNNSTFLSVKPDEKMEDILFDTTNKMFDTVRDNYIMKLKKEYRSE